MLVDVGKDPIGSLLGLHGLHPFATSDLHLDRAGSSTSCTTPWPIRRRLGILRVIDQWCCHSPLLESAARPSCTRSVDAALDFTAFRSGPTRSSWHASRTRSVSAFQRSRAVRHHRSPAQRLRGRAPRLLIICASYGSLEGSDDTGASSGLESFGTADLLAMRFRPLSKTVHSRRSERFAMHLLSPPGAEQRAIRHSHGDRRGHDL